MKVEKKFIANCKKVDQINVSDLRDLQIAEAQIMGFYSIDFVNDRKQTILIVLILIYLSFLIDSFCYTYYVL